MIWKYNVNSHFRGIKQIFNLLMFHNMEPENQAAFANGLRAVTAVSHTSNQSSDKRQESLKS